MVYDTGTDTNPLVNVSNIQINGFNGFLVATA